jgi:hypothetical protein
MEETPALTSPQEALANLWQLADGDADMLKTLTLSGTDPVLPSSFCIGTAAQASIAAATLAASQLWRLRNTQSQQSHVDIGCAKQ